MSQNGQAHLKNTGANNAEFLEYVRPSWHVIY